MTPGEILTAAEPVRVNDGLPVVSVTVRNRGDRPVQIGSHFHFAEVNPALEFDRLRAVGRRLDIPAGTSVRFEPGVERDVDLVPYRGARIAAGFRGEFGGAVDA